MQGNAVVFEDKLQVAFRQVEIPEPEAGDVVTDTKLSWISNGTESSFLRGERIDGETPYRPGAPWPFPYAAGYQSVGVVRETGPDAPGFEPGDWVFCSAGRVAGMYEPSAGHISPKVSPASQVWKLPKGLDPLAASGLVLTQTGYNCGIRAPAGLGTNAIVLGDGLVGHWTAQTLHWRGAHVLLAGKHDERLALWPGGGGRSRVNVTQESLEDAVRRAWPMGADILVDTVGSVDTVMGRLDLLRHDGHIVSAGFNGLDSAIDVQKLRFGEISWHSPSGWTRPRMNETLRLIHYGRLETVPLITHRFPVREAAKAWRLILERGEPVLGVVLDWDAVK